MTTNQKKTNSINFDLKTKTTLDLMISFWVFIFLFRFSKYITYIFMCTYTSHTIAQPREIRKSNIYIQTIKLLHFLCRKQGDKTKDNKQQLCIHNLSKTINQYTIFLTQRPRMNCLARLRYICCCFFFSFVCVFCLIFSTYEFFSAVTQIDIDP